MDLILGTNPIASWWLAIVIVAVVLVVVTTLLVMVIRTAGAINEDHSATVDESLQCAEASANDPESSALSLPQIFSSKSQVIR